MNKNFKIALKITLLFMVLAISVLSGVSFKFPESWNFSTNVLVMSKTFLNCVASVSLLRVPRLIEKYVSAKKGK